MGPRFFGVGDRIAKFSVRSNSYKGGWEMERFNGPQAEYIHMHNL